MPTERLIVLGVLIFATLVAGIAADSGTLLVESYGKLFFIRTDTTQQDLGDSIISAVLSRDGRKLAFTQVENPRSVPNSSQILSVMTLGGGLTRQISKLPAGAHFGSIGWLPDGNAVHLRG